MQNKAHRMLTQVYDVSPLFALHMLLCASDLLRWRLCLSLVFNNQSYMTTFKMEDYRPIISQFDECKYNY